MQTKLFKKSNKNLNKIKLFGVGGVPKRNGVCALWESECVHDISPLIIYLSVCIIYSTDSAGKIIFKVVENFCSVKAFLILFTYYSTLLKGNKMDKL